MSMISALPAPPPLYSTSQPLRPNARLNQSHVSISLSVNYKRT
jgi:hypothetical protein